MTFFADGGFCSGIVDGDCCAPILTWRSFLFDTLDLSLVCVGSVDFVGGVLGDRRSGCLAMEAMGPFLRKRRSVGGRGGFVMLLVGETGEDVEGGFIGISCLIESQ